MIRPLRALVLGLALSFAAGAAFAADYIVVASNDPAIAKGAAFDGGEKVPLASGRTVTLMHASGNMVRLTGTKAGAIAPARKAGQAEAERLAVLRMIVTPPEKQTSIYATRTRAICPTVESITTLDGVVQTHRSGCKTEAAAALDAWVAAHPPTDA